MAETNSTVDKEYFRERLNKDKRFLSSHIIKDRNHFSKDFAKLFMNEDFKDVTMVSSQGVKIPAHRIILATRCTYYTSLLFGQMKEAKDEEVKTNISTEVLKQLLKFIYVGRMNLLKCSTLEIMELLDRARMMFLDDLYRQVLQFVCDNLTSEKYKGEKDNENRGKIQGHYSSKRLSYSPLVTDEQFIKDAIQILNESIKNNFPELMNLSISFIKENISVVLESNYFDILTPMSINELLRLDALDSSQVKVFKAIVDWMSANNEELDEVTKEDLLRNIRLHKMSYEDLCKVVRPTGLFSDTVLMDAINARLAKGEDGVKQIGRQKSKQIPRWITEMNFRFANPIFEDDLLIADESEIGEEVVEMTENQFNGYDESSDKDVKFDINDATLHVCLKIDGSCDTCEERDKVDDTSDNSDSESDVNEEEDMEESESDHLEKGNIIDNHEPGQKPTLEQFQKETAKVLEREVPYFEKYLKQREAHFLFNENMDFERESGTPSDATVESSDATVETKKRKKSYRLTKQSKVGKK